jgi:hypothetical protein
MDTITFDAAGGTLFAEVRAGFANPGSYTLTLWEKNSNSKAMPDREGNFINSDDDKYPLPTPVSQNDGRIVETFVTLSPPAGSKKYVATLTISQGSTVLGEVSVPGETDDPSVTLDLFAKLKAQ